MKDKVQVESAVISFSQSKFETGWCFQAGFELAPPHLGELGDNLVEHRLALLLLRTRGMRVPRMRMLFFSAAETPQILGLVNAKPSHNSSRFGDDPMVRRSNARGPKWRRLTQGVNPESYIRPMREGTKWAENTHRARWSLKHWDNETPLWLHEAFSSSRGGNT